MKKNLLSVLILVLLVVDIALTAVMMISITGTNKKTAELVTSIATVMNLELYSPGGVSVADVPISETETYDLDELMIPLAMSVTTGEDGQVSGSKQSYIIFTLSLFQNTKHEDYKDMGGEENLAAYESQIKDIVNTVVGSHTLEDCQNDFDSIRDEILQGIQRLFGSNFIYKIGISGVKFG